MLTRRHLLVSGTALGAAGSVVQPSAWAATRQGSW